MRLLPLLVLAALLAAAPVAAQQTAQTYTPPKPPPCVCQPTPPWTLRPFDLTLPAHLITLRTTVPVPGGAFLLVYSAPLAHAALIDPRTGLAQILPVDPGLHHGVVFDGVEVLTPSFFVWRSGDVAWGQKWHSAAPWVPMPGWSWR